MGKQVQYKNDPTKPYNVLAEYTSPDSKDHWYWLEDNRSVYTDNADFYEPYAPKPRVPVRGEWWSNAEEIDYPGSNNLSKVLEYGEHYVVVRPFGTGDRAVLTRKEWDADFSYHSNGSEEN